MIRLRAGAGWRESASPSLPRRMPEPRARTKWSGMLVMALSVEEVVVARAQAQFDQRAVKSAGHSLVLPTVIGLELPQGDFGRRVPLIGGFALQITLLNQSLLNLIRALTVNLLLPALLGMLTLARLTSWCASPWLISASYWNGWSQTVTPSCWLRLRTMRSPA